MTAPRIKVENMHHLKTGRSTPNQFIITTQDGRYYQSYDKIIAFKPYNRETRTQLDRKYWIKSATTTKYLTLFLGESKDEILNNINCHAYELTNLQW